MRRPYSTKLIPFKLLRFTPTKSPFIDQIWELLLHQVIDLGDGIFQALSGGAGDV
jgi:hypothetical protein